MSSLDFHHIDENKKDFNLSEIILVYNNILDLKEIYRK